MIGMYVPCTYQKCTCLRQYAITATQIFINDRVSYQDMRHCIGTSREWTRLKHCRGTQEGTSAALRPTKGLEEVVANVVWPPEPV